MSSRNAEDKGRHAITAIAIADPVSAICGCSDRTSVLSTGPPATPEGNIALTTKLRWTPGQSPGLPRAGNAGRP